MVACGAVAGGMLALASVGRAAPAGEESETNTASGQTRTHLVHATGTVTGIDRSTRTVMFKTEDGQAASVVAPADAKAFDALKVSDKVDIDYYESLAISMAPSGTKPSMAERKGRAVDMGGGITGRELTMTAEVMSVDPNADTVTFKGPKGNVRTVYVSNPANQAKLPSLKPGQVVQFKYTEAVATSIRPSSK